MVHSRCLRCPAVRLSVPAVRQYLGSDGCERETIQDERQVLVFMTYGNVAILRVSCRDRCGQDRTRCVLCYQWHLRADRDRHSLYSREKVDGPTITHADYGMAPPLVRRIPRSFAGAKGVTKLSHIQHALETEAA